MFIEKEREEQKEKIEMTRRYQK